MRLLSTRDRHTSAIDYVYPRDIKKLNDVEINRDDIIIVDCSITQEQFDSTTRPLLDKGHRFIYDQLWESLHHKVKSDMVLPYAENGIAFFGHDISESYGWPANKSFHVPMHFWYHSALNVFRWKKVPTNPPNPNRTVTHDFLMPINSWKIPRIEFLTLLGNRIDKSIYSIGWEKKYLPDDAPNFNDRHFNQSWYDDTHYSLVVESWITGPTFITEKTFKAIQYGHPFLIFGVAKSLQLLKQYGFETYANLFDESYDDEPDYTLRMQKIIEQVDAFDASKLHTVMPTVSHNWNRFHNRDLVVELLKKEIHEPIERFYS